MDKRDSRQRGGIAQAQNAQENLHISKQQKNYLTNRPKKNQFESLIQLMMIIVVVLSLLFLFYVI